MNTADRPLIGLPVSPPEDGSPYYNMNPEYTDTIRRAGGDPLAFPLVPDPAYADRMMTFIHGLILIGSAYDLDPEWYGQAPHEKLKSPDRARDEFDRLLLERAFERALPVLGICHGCQAVNVFLGGTLIQDIPSRVPGAITHRARSATGEYVHEVALAPQSILNSTGEVVMANTNSAHDQAIDRLGRGLRAVAHTRDGVIEAIEGEDLARHFVLGVQWHPERLAATDGLSFRAFEKTIEAAAAWKIAHCDER